MRRKLQLALRKGWQLIRWQGSPIPKRQPKLRQLELDWHTKAANGVDD